MKNSIHNLVMAHCVGYVFRPKILARYPSPYFLLAMLFWIIGSIPFQIFFIVTNRMVIEAEKNVENRWMRSIIVGSPAPSKHQFSF